ncbi:serine hydrolase domain-containing protein [Gordonia sp. ABSL1-1]|uniref:serine hydrolase domain-containing protein n=1 Tax=Gordonia sp. ABSL1-1 TaxID=3053923 RepID=UPI002573B33A|nr:serine hydrolase domain-containing protein [Gordonia sp. ABSL1-1]MDL9936752.1 serine hydrolase domain-containing protein [Gordonia sp. ABSL1-1]
MSPKIIHPDRIAEAAQSALDAAVTGTDRVPGVVAGITTAASTIHLGAAGRNAIGADTPIGTDAVFGIFSTTKALTATVALQLAEQGHLDLDAPARDYAPTLGDVQVITGFDDDGAPRLRPPASPPTTRQLLTHTAGFGYAFFNATYRRYAKAVGVPPVDRATMAALRTPLLFDPGTRWEYGANLDWVGLVIEGVTGQCLSATMTERLLAPLGMSDTGFTLTGDMGVRRAMMHTRRDGELVELPGWAQPAEPEIDMGGQGLYSTVGDYLKFIRMWLRDGTSDSGIQILSPQTVANAATNQIGDLRVTKLPGVIPAVSHDIEMFPGIPKSWGLSFMINEADAPTGRPAGSLGWAGLANLYFWIDRRNGIGGFWATQVFPFGDPGAFAHYTDYESAVYRALA